jgi:hypothetical protein
MNQELSNATLPTEKILQFDENEKSASLASRQRFATA